MFWGDRILMAAIVIVSVSWGAVTMRAMPAPSNWLNGDARTTVKFELRR